MNKGLVALLAGTVGCILAQPISASDAVTYKEKVLHTFQGGVDGATPGAALTDVNGTLYGTTNAGGGTGCGGSGCGTVFSIDPNTGAETVLHSFCIQQNCADGARPDAALIVINGLLFGTTYFGGLTGCGQPNGCGTVFSIDPSTDNEKVVYSFCSQSFAPMASCQPVFSM